VIFQAAAQARAAQHVGGVTLRSAGLRCGLEYHLLRLDADVLGAGDQGRMFGVAADVNAGGGAMVLLLLPQGSG